MEKNITNCKQSTETTSVSTEQDKKTVVYEEGNMNNLDQNSVTCTDQCTGKDGNHNNEIADKNTKSIDENKSITHFNPYAKSIVKLHEVEEKISKSMEEMQHCTSNQSNSKIDAKSTENVMLPGTRNMSSANLDQKSVTCTDQCTDKGGIDNNEVAGKNTKSIDENKNVTHFNPYAKSLVKLNEGEEKVSKSKEEIQHCTSNQKNSKIDTESTENMKIPAKRNMSSVNIMNLSPRKKSNARKQVLPVEMLVEGYAFFDDIIGVAHRRNNGEEAYNLVLRNMVFNKELEQDGFSAYVAIRDKTSGKEDKLLTTEEGYPKFLFLSINVHHFQDVKQAHIPVLQQCQKLRTVRTYCSQSSIQFFVVFSNICVFSLSHTVRLHVTQHIISLLTTINPLQMKATKQEQNYLFLVTSFDMLIHSVF